MPHTHDYAPCVWKGSAYVCSQILWSLAFSARPCCAPVSPVCLVLPIWTAHSKSPSANVCMQLDLMTKIRDNKIYENRARFQKHAAQPLNFSSFQIQEYLKASAFRWQPAPCLLSDLCMHERMSHRILACLSRDTYHPVSMRCRTSSQLDHDRRETIQQLQKRVSVLTSCSVCMQAADRRAEGHYECQRCCWC